MDSMMAAIQCLSDRMINYEQNGPDSNQMNPNSNNRFPQPSGSINPLWSRDEGGDGEDELVVANILKARTYLKKRLKDCLNFFVAAFLVSVPYTDWRSALRTADNIHETQKDSYQLGILTLNLGHVNRVPYIGGSSKFPSWVRKDTEYRCLPYLVYSSHITCLCEASDEHGGIALHQQVARDHGMIGMVVHPEINSQSVALFIR